MAVEEDWHGRPMIDGPTHLWIIAACLVAAAFLVGGAVAGRRRPSAAPEHATAAASLAVAVLFVAAVLRRLWLVHEVCLSVWCDCGSWSCGGPLSECGGSLLGRRFTTDIRLGSRRPADDRDRVQPHTLTDAVSSDEDGTGRECHNERAKVQETPPPRRLSAGGGTQPTVC